MIEVYVLLEFFGEMEWRETVEKPKTSSLQTAQVNNKVCSKSVINLGPIEWSSTLCIVSNMVQ